MPQSYRPRHPVTRPEVAGSRRVDAGSPLAGPHVQPCPDCDSTERVQGPGSGKHHASERCGGCGRFIAWIPAPLTIEKALNFRLPYGKHANVPFGTLARTAPDYLIWITEAFVATPHARRIGQMAAMVLDDAIANAAKGGRS